MKRLLLCLVLLVCLTGQAWAEVQLLPAWERLTPTSAKGASYSGGICAAKGETESFQLGVWAPKGSYQVWWSAPVGLTITAYSEQWTYTARTATSYPDGLLPIANGGLIAIADSKPGAVWFDVKVSRTAKPGAVKVNVKCGASTRIVTVNVWNFAVPASPRLKSAIGLNTTRGKLAVELLLLDNRLMATFVDSAHAVQLAAAGQTQAHVGGYASMSGTSVATAPPTVAQIDAWVAKYKPLQPYSYVQDEEYEAAALANLNIYSKNMAGKVKRMLTTKITASSAWLDIVCAMPKFLTDDLIASRVNVGKEVWMYQTLSQDTYTPKWLLHYPYPNWALMSGFLPYRYRITGILYWRADYEKSGYNPWVNADAYGTSYPGEASWLLPLLNGKPSATYTGATSYAPTIRLKWLRDGVDTYDYLSLLNERGLKSFADSVTATVAPDFKNWSRDPAAIEAARRKLGAKLGGA